MKYPSKELFGKTWVGWLNFLILQWLFIRLQGDCEKCLDGSFDLTAWDIRIALPLTGWWSSYYPKKVYYKIYTFKK